MMDELPPPKCHAPARAARHQQCVHVNTVQSADRATDALLDVHFGSPQTSHTSALNCSADDRAVSTVYCPSLSVVTHHLMSDELQTPTAHSQHIQKTWHF
jgi:hypothetical protein